MNNKEGCEKGPAEKDTKCCQVDALVTVDGRGQIVLPKDLREKAEIKAGDKLVVISHESEGKICCFSLFKADELGEPVKGILGPMMKELIK